MKTATLHLENGRRFEIEAKDQSHTDVYVEKIVLNGRALDRRFLTSRDILAGGKVVFYMGPKPVN